MAVLDWPRRHALMRMHTALHLLCSLLPGAAVTGGQIGADRSRLDFDLPEAPAKDALEDGFRALIAAAHTVTAEWVDEAVLDSNPGLVRTLSVKPPRGTGRLRLVRIGDAPGGLAALRRHARRQHGGDRRHQGAQDREQGPAEPPHRPGAGGIGWTRWSRRTGWRRTLASRTWSCSTPPSTCPTRARTAFAEFTRAHIPGARFFDIDAVADTGHGPAAHGPDPGPVRAAAGRAGRVQRQPVVFYDQKGIASAPRGWWMMGLFGHDAACRAGRRPAQVAAGWATRPKPGRLRRRCPAHVPRQPPCRAPARHRRHAASGAGTCWCWMPAPPGASTAPRRSLAPACPAATCPAAATCPSPRC